LGERKEKLKGKENGEKERENVKEKECSTIQEKECFVPFNKSWKEM